MKFVAYNLNADHTRLPADWIMVWQDSAKELRERFAAYFADLDARQAKHPKSIKYEVYRGHVIVRYFGYCDTVVSDPQSITQVVALDCKGFLGERTTNRGEQRYYGLDRVETVTTFDHIAYPKAKSDDSTVNPAYQFVDMLLDQAVPFFEAVKTVPLLPIPLCLTGPEEQELMRQATLRGMTRHDLMRETYLAGVKALSAGKRRQTARD